MKVLRLTKEDGEDIAFVRASLVLGAINFSEFKQWVDYAVQIEDDLPTYMWDLMDLENKFDFNPIKIMGYIPSWRHTENEVDALEGIGYKRHVDFTSDAISREDALRKLRENPHIEERFRATFPFIDY